MKAQLRAVDNERPHARDIARREVKRFRTIADRERLPICNQSTGAKNLFVDEVIARTERAVREAPRSPKVNPLFALLLILLSVIGIYLAFTNL